MRLAFKQLEVAECIVVADVKQFSRIDILDDNTMITDVFIPAARRFCENYINSAILPQSWYVWYDIIKDKYDCKRYLQLPHNKVIQITSLKNYDDENAETTFSSSNYMLSGSRLLLDSDSDWSTDVRMYDSMKIEIMSGFGAVSGLGAVSNTVPADIKIAMNMIAAHWYQQREAGSEVDFKNVPFGVTAILEPYRNFIL